MDDVKFKKTNRIAACTENPIQHLIPFGIRQQTLLKIKQESIDIYGHDVMAECSKRLTCLKKTCAGRPLAWNSPTAKPYLEELAKTQSIVDQEMVIVTNCQVCPIRIKCTSTCDQVSDFIERDKGKEPDNIQYKDLTDNLVADTYENSESPNILPGYDIPWDVLNPLRKQVVELYLYENNDFTHVAKKTGLYDQAAAKYEFYAALTTLSEYAVVRKFVKDKAYRLNADIRTIMEQVYIYNKPVIALSKELGVSFQSVHARIDRLLKEYDITWYKFVQKKDGKPIYNVPQLLK